MNKALLLKRISEAPRMEPKDAVKLVFQSEFGCGHLFSGMEPAAAWLREELKTTTVDESMPCAVGIGGGYCRLNLAAPEVRAIGAERIADMMRVTSAHAHGDMTRFEASLARLERLAQEGKMPFSLESLANYLRQYRAQGCPPVSHSEAYRAAYAPAYRVVLEDMGALTAVIAEMERRLQADGRVIVVLDGMCGAGKTTLAGVLGELYGTQPLHMDDFFLPFDMRTKDRLNQPGGNVHYERFASEVLTGLARGGEVRYRRFDCRTGDMLDKTFLPGRVVLIEGTYSHHPAFEEAYRLLHALRVFVWTDDGEQLRRLERRCPEMLKTFETRWIPLEKRYFLAYDRKHGANIALKSLPWEDEP